MNIHVIFMSYVQYTSSKYTDDFDVIEILYTVYIKYGLKISDKLWVFES